MSDWDDWTRELGDFWQHAARLTEVWAEETLNTAIAAADTFADEVEKQVSPTIEQWADDLHRTMEPIETVLDEEAERLSVEFTEFMTPVVVPLADAMEAWFASIATPLNNTIEPLVNDHPTCVGCRHYYGQAHGGNLLVCAMYPYGPDQEKCPDWESVWRQPSNSG